MIFALYHLIFHLICIIFWLYLCFLMIIGNNSHVPQFYRINLGKLENLFFNVFNFEGPKRSPNYLKLYESQFFHGTRLRREGSAIGEPRGPNKNGPRGQIPWSCGACPFSPRCSDAVNLCLDRFILT
jgi:hypothetical protein